MDLKEIQYLVEGLFGTLNAFYEEVHDTLVAKGKKKLGQEDIEEGPQLSELIERTRERRRLTAIIAGGKGGEDELIEAIGREIRRVLSVAGIATRDDLARVEKRMEEIEQALEEKEKRAGVYQAAAD
ncbi:MAG TPA: hypothetical protein VIK22_02190 [Candidatus Anoxymicrobiaceae bacterium]